MGKRNLKPKPQKPLIPRIHEKASIIYGGYQAEDGTIVDGDGKRMHFPVIVEKAVRQLKDEVLQLRPEDPELATETVTREVCSRMAKNSNFVQARKRKKAAKRAYVAKVQHPLPFGKHQPSAS